MVEPDKRFRLVPFFVILITLFIVACGGDEVPPDLPTLPVEVNTNSTPTLNALARATATIAATQAAVEPLVTATPTAVPAPTDPPSLRERLALAKRAMEVGNFAMAVEHYAAVAGQSADESVRTSARLDLGIAHFANENYSASRAILNQVLNVAEPPIEALYFRAEISRLEGKCDRAINDYESLLQLMPDLTSYIHMWIASCHTTLGNSAEAIAAYELAQQSDAYYVVTYQQRLALTQLYQDAGRLEDSAELYLIMSEAARTDFTRGETAYLAAKALIEAGDIEGGFEIYQGLLKDVPENYTTYLGLVELITGGAIVDQFDRGLVDYYAEAWVPCIDAFVTYLAQNEETFDQEALLYLALCYEGVGNTTEALATLETYAGLSSANAVSGLLEQGHVLRRAGTWDDAFELYEGLIETYGADPLAGEALFWMARIRDFSSEPDEAIALYERLAASYPDYERSAEGLFRAGYLADLGNNQTVAYELWETAARNYPNEYHGESALTWLITRKGSDDALLALTKPYAARDAYYSARVADLSVGNRQFGASAGLNLELDRDSAETELKQLLDLPADSDISTLPGFVRSDPHLIRAEQLWALRRFEDAKFEFENVRLFYADNLLVSYQLANYFKDVGLYRSSIIAAQSVINGLGGNPFEVPAYVAGLAYPVYYADLILEQAEQYGYDPLVQFALVRQESLYESFATSFAAAQGLAQVIPDTGYYIAEKLAWPDYVNEDLYKPWVGLTFGAFYLDEQLTFFDRAIHPALAAYNAGPGNAWNWWQIAGNDIDVYVETIAFSETRAYIERIYTGHAVYRHLYGTGAIEAASLVPSP